MLRGFLTRCYNKELKQTEDSMTVARTQYRKIDLSVMFLSSDSNKTRNLHAYIRSFPHKVHRIPFQRIQKVDTTEP